MKTLINYLKKYSIIIVTILISLLMIIIFILIMLLNSFSKLENNHYDVVNLNNHLINMINNNLTDLYSDNNTSINKIISFNYDENYFYISADGNFDDINILYNLTFINSHLDIDELLINIDHEFNYELDTVDIYSYEDTNDFTSKEIFIDNFGKDIAGKISNYNSSNYYSGIIKSNNKYEVYYLLEYKDNTLIINKKNDVNNNSIYYSYISYLYSLNK